MKTAPQEIAASSAGPPSIPNNDARKSGSSLLTPSWPAATAVKLRYVGALSSTDDRAPEAQKYCHGAVTPSSSPRALSSSRGAVIVAKIPKKTTATAAIGAKLKWLLSWIAR